MVKHYLAVALRGFLSNKLFSFINVFGLAVGLASAILIGLYVADELSYDGFHPDADRVYRLGRDIYPREDFAGLNMATLPSIAAEQLQQDYPEIERIARASTGAGLVGHGAVAFYENDMLYADPALLQILHFDWLVGDPATALDAPTSIVVTESFARKYFGEQAAFGQVLTFENRTEMTVTGMIRDLPANTHLRASALRPLSVLLGVLPEEARTGWGWNIMHTYVRFASGTNVKVLSATFPAFMDRHLAPLAGGNKASQASGITAINVRDIHLRSSLQNEMSSPGSMAEVLSLVVIAAGIVLIGCFNFMNLSTAQSALRGKDVGIRKTIGADRRQLIVQFLGESVGMALFAILIAIMLVEITLPAFNGFSGKQLEFDVLNDHAVQAALGLLVMMVGFLSGSYPALYLSAIKPAQVLKNHSGINLRGVVFRNLLVVLQFSISIALVIATTVVVLQMRYVRNFNPGFAKEQVLILNGSPTQGLTTRWNALRAELQHQPGVLDVTASSLVPGTENLNGTAVHLQGLPDSEAFSFSTLLVDYGFFDTYRIEILAGRSFSPDLSGDLLPPVAAESTTENSIERAANFILNAAAARAFGWAPEQAIDQFIETTGTSRVAGRVVGVVADTQFETLHHNIKPLLFLLAEQGQQSVPVFSAASLRLDGRNLPATLAAIDSAWKQVIPEFPMGRRFLSDDFQALYQDDIRLGELFSSFAGLAILIACLGLFGLATFNAQRRIKEIGVRKVMGGTVWSIVLLLTNDFSKLVLLSNLLAWPVAYFAMERWLQNFAYRIDLTPLIFIGSGLIALCIAWATVGGTAAKAASAKPVLALRYE